MSGSTPARRVTAIGASLSLAWVPAKGRIPPGADNRSSSTKGLLLEHPPPFFWVEGNGRHVESGRQALQGVLISNGVERLGDSRVDLPFCGSAPLQLCACPHRAVSS
jgi:hypothetical protein